MLESQPSVELSEAFTPLLLELERRVALFGLYEHTRPELSELEGFFNPPFDRYPETFTTVSKRYHLSPLFMGAPVGEYGQAWADRLTYTATNLLHTATNPASSANILDKIEKVSAGPYRETVDQYTFRRSKRDDSPETARMFGEHATLNDAAQTTLIVSGLFTAYRLPGYRDPLRLQTELAADGVYSQLARIIPFSVTASLGQAGLVFTEPPVEKREDGKWQLRRTVVDHFAQGLQQGVYSRQSGGRKKLERPGCPLGRTLRNQDRAGADIHAQLFARALATK